MKPKCYRKDILSVNDYFTLAINIFIRDETSKGGIQNCAQCKYNNPNFICQKGKTNYFFIDNDYTNSIFVDPSDKTYYKVDEYN